MSHNNEVLACNETEHTLVHLKPESVQETKKCYFIEPFIVLVVIGISLFELLVPNTLELQYCINVLNISQTECINASSVHIEAIQDFTSWFQMIRSTFEVIFSTVILVFMGPYSDIHGRKPFLIIASVGISIMYCLWTWASSAPFLNPTYFLLFSIPIALSGGGIMLLFMTFCYACDVTSEIDRGFRLSMLQISYYVGNVSAYILSLFITQYGYTISFAVATTLLVLSCMYANFVIDESISPQIRAISINENNPFTFNSIHEIRLAFMRQTPKIRITILLTSLAYMNFLIVLTGQSSIFYLVLQRLLGIDLFYFTLLNIFYVIMIAIGTFVCTWYFSSKLQFHDLFLISAVSFLYLSSDLFLMFSSKAWHIYFCLVIACPHGLADPLFKSFLSKTVPSSDLGKISSFLGISQGVSYIIGSIMYNSLYETTLTFYPEAVFILSATLMLTILFILAILTKLQIAPNQSTS